MIASYVILLQVGYSGPANVWLPVGFALAMMAIAALVAAAGDRMGHRAARRKLRIGKLRPRHVSTLIAVLTGVLISLISFGTVFAVWKDFRTALLHYSSLKADVVQATKDRDTAQRAAADAQQQASQATAALATAQTQVKAQGAEIQQKTAAIGQISTKLSGTQSALAAKQAQLHGLEARRDELQGRIKHYNAEISDLSRKKETESFRVDSLKALVEKAHADLDQLNKQIGVLQKGQGVIPVGQELGHLRVNGGDKAAVQKALADKLLAIRQSLQKQGLDFDPASRDKAAQFSSSLPADGGDYLIIIRSAVNVFEGQPVPLDFSFQPLAPLVTAGSAVLDIQLFADHAQIRAIGGVNRSVPVPSSFDKDSLANLASDVQDAFRAGASSAGFLADEQTGEIASPVERLVDVADQLMSMPRPLRIQFVTKRSATALDSSVLAEAELHLTNLEPKSVPPDSGVPTQPPVSPAPKDESAPPSQPNPAPPEGNGQAPRSGAAQA